MEWSYLCGQSHTSAGEETILRHGGHHAELALVDKCREVIDLLLEAGLLLVLLLVGVGGLGAGVGVGERRHCVDGVSIEWLQI